MSQFTFLNLKSNAMFIIERHNNFSVFKKCLLENH